MLVGNKIYDLRKKENLSQEQLAEKLNVSRQTISNWETNQTVPDVYQIKTISEVFKIGLDELLENDAFISVEEKKNMHYIELWEKAKINIENELSPLVYDTWFGDVEIISIEDNILTLLVPLEVHKTILKKEYKKLIFNSVNEFAFQKVDKIECEIKNV